MSSTIFALLNFTTSIKIPWSRPAWLKRVFRVGKKTGRGRLGWWTWVHLVCHADLHFVKKKKRKNKPCFSRFMGLSVWGTKKKDELCCAFSSSFISCLNNFILFWQKSNKNKITKRIHTYFFSSIKRLLVASHLNFFSLPRFWSFASSLFFFF